LLASVVVPLTSSIVDDDDGVKYLMITIPEPPLPPSTELSAVP
jgi:hypothetical protein